MSSWSDTTLSVTYVCLYSWISNVTWIKTSEIRSAGVWQNSAFDHFKMDLSGDHVHADPSSYVEEELC